MVFWRRKDEALPKHVVLLNVKRLQIEAGRFAAYYEHIADEFIDDNDLMDKICPDLVGLPDNDVNELSMDEYKRIRRLIMRAFFVALLEMGNRRTISYPIRRK